MGPSGFGTLDGRPRRDGRFRVWACVRILRVSTDSARNVQEESHIREFPNGIGASSNHRVMLGASARSGVNRALIAPQ